MPIRTRARCRALLLIGLLLALPCAALEPAYLEEMPDPKRVLQDFAGSDRLDTLALQLAALGRLSRIVVEMAGDRYHTPGRFPMPDEQRVLDSIRAVSEPLFAEAEATFDPKLTGADTPRAEWRRKLSRYQASPELYAQLMERYFSPAFRDAHLASLADKDATLRAVREQEARGRRALAGEAEPVPPRDYTLPLAIGAAMSLLLVFGNLHLLRRIRISAKDTHVLRVGLKRLRLDWATGVITNYSHRDDVQHYTDIRKDRLGNDEPYSYFKTTRHEQFVLAGAQGDEPFELTRLFDGTTAGRLDSGFDESDGHRVTALWLTEEDQRSYLRFHNWTRRADVEHQATWGVLERLTPLRPWTVAPAFVLGWVVGDVTRVFGFLKTPGFPALAMALLAMLTWLIGFRVLAWHRRRTFARDELTSLVARLGGG